jgi:hypothetical protein
MPDVLNRVRWLAAPLAAYLLITLGLPILNGAGRRPELARHAAVVLGMCVLVALAVVAMSAAVSLLRRKS